MAIASYLADFPAVPGPSKRLSRASLPRLREPPPVRIVHLGLGNFHRAHQVWYTAHCDDAAHWGIAAFTGRSPRVARALAAQGGLYTLIERGPEGDRAEIIGSLSHALDGADLRTFCELLSRPEVAVVSLTVTEPGYHVGVDGSLTLDDPAVVQDRQLLRVALAGDAACPALGTPMARLALGLERRRLAGGWPIAVVPCDNLVGNGSVVAHAVRALAAAAGAQDLLTWIDRDVAFVSTSVDRITPRATADDLDTAATLTGWLDSSPVVTEPFSDWVLSGDFPSGRPHWESAGARFASDIAPFEARKLWLLNGAHSTLAYLGPLRGHTAVSDAMADAGCRAAVEALWIEAMRHLPAGLDVGRYCNALVARFTNPRMRHLLAQIGMEGVAKLRVRIVPVARAELADGRDADGCAHVLAAWIARAEQGTLPPDSSSAGVREAIARPGDGSVRAMVRLLDGELAATERFIRSVSNALHEYRNDKGKHE